MSLLQISLRRLSLQRPLVKLQYKVVERLLRHRRKKRKKKKESLQQLRQRRLERHLHQPVSQRKEHQISSRKQRLSQSRSVS